MKTELTNAELVKRMRMCVNENCEGCTYQYEGLTNTDECKEDLLHDAADALEAADKRIAELEIETERLKSSNDELRERQTYIDHWGNKWMTSGKDVPTEAYNHGFFDGEQAVSVDLRSVRKGEQE